MNQKQSWNLITLFLILIYGLGLAVTLVPDQTYSETENRTLTQLPAFSLSSILSGDFEETYEDYLSDQFVLRVAWVGLKTTVQKLIGQTESKDIYFADDDYLIEKHTGTFTAEQAIQNQSLLTHFVSLYKDTYKDHLTVMIVPNAVEILEDHLPRFASPYDESIYLDQLAEEIPDSIWFDACQILQNHTDEQLYYRTDHHWTTTAAFYVYQKWAEQQGLAVPKQSDYTITTVTEDFQGTIQSKLGIETRKDSIQEYLLPDNPWYTLQAGENGEISYSLYDNSKLETKDKYAVFFGGNQALLQLQTRAGTGRKLLVIKDSYANCFIPFTITEFDTIDMIDIRYYNQKLSERITQEGYTDILFLYNASGFAEETNLAKLLY